MVIMSKHVALNAFLAIGMTFVIITGGIDLSVGSIVGLCGMVGGLAGAERRSTSASARRSSSTPSRSCLIVVLVGVRRRGRQRAAHHPAERRALHRHAGHALRRAGRGAAVVGRRDLPEPGRQRRIRVGQLPAASGRAAFWASRSRSGSWSPWRWRRPMSRARTPLGRHIYAVGGNERRRGAVGRQGQPGEDVRLHVLGLLRGAGRADHRLAARRPRIPRPARPSSSTPSPRRCSAAPRCRAGAAGSAAPSSAPSSSASCRTGW